MHSRAVLLLSVLALACLVVIGTITLHLTSASASTDGKANDRRGRTLSDVENAVSGSETSSLGFFRNPEDAPASESAAAVVLSHAELASVDSVRALLREVHVKFEPEGSGVSNAMIPYLAEMITVINQHAHLVYRIEIHEPDAALARRRAQTLNDVLRLNVLEPSKLRIVGRQGLHSTQVDVSAT